MFILLHIISRDTVQLSYICPPEPQLQPTVCVNWNVLHEIFISHADTHAH